MSANAICRRVRTDSDAIASCRPTRAATRLRGDVRSRVRVDRHRIETHRLRKLELNWSVSNGIHRYNPRATSLRHAHARRCNVDIAPASSDAFTRPKGRCESEEIDATERSSNAVGTGGRRGRAGDRRRRRVRRRRLLLRQRRDVRLVRDRSRRAWPRSPILPSTPPADDSNAYATNPDAITLGKMFYFDTRFSGPSTWLDGLNRTMPFGRTRDRSERGRGLHQLSRPRPWRRRSGQHPGRRLGGRRLDLQQLPPNVRFRVLLFASLERPHRFVVGPGGRRQREPADHQRQPPAHGLVDQRSLRRPRCRRPLPAYPTVFADPLPPFGGPSSSVQAMVDATGQCPPPVNGVCPTAGCRGATTTATGTVDSCWPVVPLQGKPGKTAGCQPGLASEPFGDAWDCMDPDVQTAVTRMLVNFGKAIAAYEGTLILGPSPFDQWVADLQAGHGDSSTAISGPAKIGAQLFVGKAGCSDCHNTPLFSDSLFHNVGVGQIGAGVPTVEDCPAGGVCDCAPIDDDHPTGPKNCLPFGATDGLQKLQANGFLRSSSLERRPELRPARLRTARRAPPIGGYRTPSLRNVSLTAPYMHDGSIATLADVVWHYNQGISDENTPGDAGRFVQAALSLRRRAGRSGGVPRVAGIGAPARRRARAADASLGGRRRKATVSEANHARRRAARRRPSRSETDAGPSSGRAIPSLRNLARATASVWPTTISSRAAPRDPPRPRPTNRRPERRLTGRRPASVGVGRVPASGRQRLRSEIGFLVVRQRRRTDERAGQRRHQILRLLELEPIDARPIDITNPTSSGQMSTCTERPVSAQSSGFTGRVMGRVGLSSRRKACRSFFSSDLCSQNGSFGF